tara:strand:+ start:1346 stop:1750 length:405 start_codon:yes stop_codon:yes gene_type:complete
MAEKGLRSWVKENWVDIANKKSDGSYPKCGRSGGEKRKNYPKCVPIAKARAMSKGQRAGAVKRKQAKSNTGPTPSRAATFAPKRKRAASGGSIGDKMIREAQRNYKGSYISGDLGGVKVSNPSLVKYYGSKIKP